MKLAETFLSLVRRASSDLDVEKLRDDVRRFAARHPELSARGRAERLVAVTAKKAAALGGVAGLPPGWAAFAAMGPELAALLVLQSRLVVGVHLLYGHEPEPEERALEVLAGLAAGAGIHLGRRFGARAMEVVAGKIALRALGREATHFVPLLGAAAGAALNYAAVRALGRAVIARVESLYGPPEIPGAGRVLDVAGTVS